MKLERDKTMTGTISSYKHVPNKDIIVSNDSTFNENYPNGFFCYCGMVVKFKHQQTSEKMLVICPNCGRRIIYEQI